MTSERHKWNVRYKDAEISGYGAARVLKENLHLLPSQGKALDLACGLGNNALLLAELGLDTWAWDFSDVAISKLRDFAAYMGVKIHAEVRDILARPPEPNSFDVITVSHFLERNLAPVLEQALNPGGVLYYQTFFRDAVKGGGPGNPEFRLKANELLALFPRLRLLVYREEAAVGEVTRGFRDEAMFIGLKV